MAKRRGGKNGVGKARRPSNSKKGVRNRYYVGGCRI